MTEQNDSTSNFLVGRNIVKFFIKNNSNHIALYDALKSTFTIEME